MIYLSIHDKILKNDCIIYRTLSEARSVGGTLPASTGRAASSTRLTHQVIIKSLLSLVIATTEFI